MLAGSSATDGILGNEFDQRWIAEIVPTFEENVLADQLRMRIQVRPQALDITRIEQVNRSPKRRVVDSFVMRQCQIVDACWLFDATLEPRPGRESALTSNGPLCVVEGK